MALTADGEDTDVFALATLFESTEDTAPGAAWPAAGREIRILSLDGSPLRHLVLDPTKDYQPM